MQRLFYWLYRVSLILFWFVPFTVLYWLSDALSFVLHRVLGYRLSIIRDNLSKCFPDKSKEEINKLIEGAYKNFTDILLESFKTPTMSRSELKKRYRFNGMDKVLSEIQRGGNVIGVGAHYGNWEWGGVAINYFFEPVVKTLYKPLKNKYIDQYIRLVRSSAGTQMIPIQQTRLLFEEKKDHPCLFVFVADQSPSNMREAIWIDFLGRDTPCLHGPEKYIKQLDCKSVFFEVSRIRRGYYSVDVIPMPIDQAAYQEHGAITKAFMGLLERKIRIEPQNWLWTHKRWKRRREEAQEQSARFKSSNLKEN